MIRIKKLIPLLFAITIQAFGANESAQMSLIGQWDNVTSFAINKSETKIIMSQIGSNGLTLAFETTNKDGIWQNPIPIETINKKITANSNFGGLSISYDESKIYFHATFADGKGGSDIYYVQRTNDGWSEPILVDELSSEMDEYSPSVAPGEQKIFFLRHKKLANAKQEKKSSNKLSIFSAIKNNTKNIWWKIQSDNYAINIGYNQDIHIAPDGVTALFSMREDKDKSAIVMYTQNIFSNEWKNPEAVFIDESNCEYFSPQYAGNHIYMIRSTNKNQTQNGSIVSIEIPKKNVFKDIVYEKSRIINKFTNAPISAEITVKDAITSAIIGKYQNNNLDGNIDIPNLSDNNYIVDIRNSEYSFNSYILNYKDKAVPQMPQTIELFDTVELIVNVYDNEILKPIESKIAAVHIVDKKIFRPQKISNGRYSFSLPIGGKYNIIANANKFNENKFLFSLEGDIVFSQFEKSIALDPIKRDITFKIIDAVTKKPLNAELIVNNSNREETFKIKQNEMQNGIVSLKLRNDDKYDLTIQNIIGFSFHNRTLDLSKISDNEIVIEINPLKENSAFTLNGITFANGSADIEANSYIELNRLVKLLRENKNLRIEISVNTNNVDNKLSTLRAESVVNYLVENGISDNRLISKCYKPSVQNTSNENNVQNRCVEIKVLGNE